MMPERTGWCQAKLQGRNRRYAGKWRKLLRSSFGTLRREPPGRGIVVQFGGDPGGIHQWYCLREVEQRAHKETMKIREKTDFAPSFPQVSQPQSASGDTETHLHAFGVCRFP